MHRGYMNAVFEALELHKREKKNLYPGCCARFCLGNGETNWELIRLPLLCSAWLLLSFSTFDARHPEHETGGHPVNIVFGLCHSSLPSSNKGSSALITRHNKHGWEGASFYGQHTASLSENYDVWDMSKTEYKGMHADDVTPISWAISYTGKM